MIDWEIAWDAIQIAAPAGWHIEGQIVQYGRGFTAQATRSDQSMLTAWGHSPKDAMHNLLLILHDPSLHELGYLTTVRLRAAWAEGLRADS